MMVLRSFLIFVLGILATLALQAIFVMPQKENVQEIPSTQTVHAFSSLYHRVDSLNTEDIWNSTFDIDTIYAFLAERDYTNEWYAPYLLDGQVQQDLLAGLHRDVGSNAYTLSHERTQEILYMLERLRTFEESHPNPWGGPDVSMIELIDTIQEELVKNLKQNENSV